MAKHLVYTTIFTFALFLLITTHFCDGRQDEEESSAVVVRGSVFCDKCSQHSLHLPTTYFIPDAIVAVECSLNRKARASIRVEGRTDQSGEFKIELPSSIYNTYSGCSVEVINSPDGLCNVPSVNKLAFTMNGQHDSVYCAGILSYRPQVLPSACFVEEEDSSEQLISKVRGREALETDESSKQTILPPPSLPNLFPPLNIPPISIPNLSVPPLPTIPSLPGLSVPPLPNLPTLPNFSIPPLPNVASIVPPSLPFNIPPLAFNIPPLPFFTPPPPSK